MSLFLLRDYGYHQTWGFTGGMKLVCYGRFWPRSNGNQDFAFHQAARLRKQDDCNLRNIFSGVVNHIHIHPSSFQFNLISMPMLNKILCLDNITSGKHKEQGISFSRKKKNQIIFLPTWLENGTDVKRQQILS